MAYLILSRSLLLDPFASCFRQEAFADAHRDFPDIGDQGPYRDRRR